MKVTVRAPGSCGELVQGTLDGQNFLVTCPIDLYSEVEIMPLAPGKRNHTNADSKTLAAVAKTRRFLGLPPEQLGKWQIVVRSELPIGKGMASSSADISAACLAAALQHGKTLTPDEIADLALAIEPTDGIFFPGIVMLDHVNGKVRSCLGCPPPLSIVMFDVGGEVDTLRFNQRTDLAALNKAKEEQVSEALALVRQGLAAGDADLIGRGSTLSAVANQSILCKPCLDTVIRLGKDCGAVGVIAAHSGTVLGVLFTPTMVLTGGKECIRAVTAVCADIQYLRTVSLISGGLTVVSEEQGDNNCA